MRVLKDLFACLCLAVLIPVALIGCAGVAGAIYHTVPTKILVTASLVWGILALWRSGRPSGI